MDPKAYLLRYQEVQHQIEANAQEALRLRSLAEKCTVSFDAQCFGSGGEGQRIPRIVENLIHLEAQTDLLTHQLETAKREIAATINALPVQTHRELLRYRYLAGMTFEQIAVRMKYSWRQVIRLHGRALQIVAAVIAWNAHSGDSGTV